MWELCGAEDVNDDAIRSDVAKIQPPNNLKLTSVFKNVGECSYPNRFCSSTARGRQIFQVDTSAVSNRNVVILKELTN